MAFHKEPCVVCGEETSTHMISVHDILKKEAEKNYICYKHYQTFLEDNELNTVLEFHKGNSIDFINRIIILDGSYQNLKAYAHRVRKRWDAPRLKFRAQAYYGSIQYGDEVEDIVHKYLNSTNVGITPEQIKYIHFLLSQSKLNDKMDIYDKYKVKSTKELTTKQASEIISKLKKGELI